MKTQINTLVSGSENRIGTSREIRKAVALAMRNENPDGMDVEVLGMQLHLNAYFSLSGKSAYYACHLTDEQAACFGLDMSVYKYDHFAEFAIHTDATVEVCTYARKTQNHQWKSRCHCNIDESNVTIL